jgi:hypothetical protein
VVVVIRIRRAIPAHRRRLGVRTAGIRGGKKSDGRDARPYIRKSCSHRKNCGPPSFFAYSIYNQRVSESAAKIRLTEQVKAAG